MNDFFTVQMLATFAGITAVTGLVVQFTKGLIKKEFDDYMVRVYAFFVSLVLNFVFVPAGYDAQGIVLTILNSILVTFTAMGGYEAFTDPFAQK